MADMKKVYHDLIIINLYQTSIFKCIIFIIYGPGRRFEGHMHNNPINSWYLYQISQVHDRKAIITTKADGRNSLYDKDKNMLRIYKRTLAEGSFRPL